MLALNCFERNFCVFLRFLLCSLLVEKSNISEISYLFRQEFLAIRLPANKEISGNNTLNYRQRLPAAGNKNFRSIGNKKQTKLPAKAKASNGNAKKSLPAQPCVKLYRTCNKVFANTTKCEVITNKSLNETLFIFVR